MEELKNFNDYLNEVKDSEGNEVPTDGYVEVMDGDGGLSDALGEVLSVWTKWKNGPATEKVHIKPAIKDLKSFIDDWFKKNIK